MKLVTGCYPYLPNKALTELVYENFHLAGSPRFTDEEKAPARELQETMGVETEEPLDEEIEFHGDEVGLFSQDDGDLSWLCPLARIRTASRAQGVPAHNWQTVVASGTSIGHKGMLSAAGVMALTGLVLYTSPETVRKAREELKARTQGFEYRCLVPAEVKPIGDPPAIILSS